MIRYPEALQDIEMAAEAQKAGWLAAAAERTEIFLSQGKYTEKYVNADGVQKTAPPIWSAVKTVYMKRQYNKCVYCETRLEGETFAPVQWDLEHYRPKGRVQPWPCRKERYDYEFVHDLPSETGYYWLACDLHNYAASCKICNTIFKKDYFPVAAARAQAGQNAVQHLEEAPFIPYPLGEGDDPEDLIAFVGPIAQPKRAQDDDELKWRAGQVIIDFFGLNRDGLVANRSWWLLYAVSPALKLAHQGDQEQQNRLAQLRSKKAPFTNCTACFIDLYHSDYNAALVQKEICASNIGFMVKD